MLFVQGIRNSWKNKKPPTHQGGGFQSSGGDLFGEFPHHTSSGTFVPDQGHLGSPRLGCQTPLGVVPDVAWDRLITAAKGNNNLCHSENNRRNVNWIAQNEIHPVCRPLQFQKRRQLFIRTRNETAAVAVP